MNATFKYDFVNKTIVASKSALRKAADPATKEYRELMGMLEAHPDFKVKERQIKKATNKTTYKGLNNKAMRDFIGDDAEKLAEYEEALKMGGHPQAKHWFLDTYNKPSMTKVNKKVAQVKVARVRANAGKKPKFSQLAPAANQ